MHCWRCYSASLWISNRVDGFPSLLQTNSVRATLKLNSTSIMFAVLEVRQTKSVSIGSILNFSVEHNAETSQRFVSSSAVAVQRVATYRSREHGSRPRRTVGMQIKPAGGKVWTSGHNLQNKTSNFPHVWKVRRDFRRNAPPAGGDCHCRADITEVIQ